MNTDWKEALACFDHLQLGPAGSITRCHVENSHAHVWHAQIQGRRAYVLFPPEDGGKLYAEEDAAKRRDPEERATWSPADILRPGRSHAKVRESRARFAVLEPGETLVVPQGWWLYSAMLEPCTTLTRRFWNQVNRDGLCDELGHIFREHFERHIGGHEGQQQLWSYV